MPTSLMKKQRWGVILAGGDGVRLRSLTRLASGDDRPKQFCTLVGTRSLLAQTRQRIAGSISFDRTLFVLMKSHDCFYSKELENVPPVQMLVQPSNRGTLPAMLYSLLHIVSLEPHAVVGFFPSDHHYSDEGNFLAGVDLAFRTAEAGSESVILLGAPATRAETEYGWIEAEAAISTDSSNELLRVKRFWEKPPQPVAEDLLNRGCVWNTFVMVGRARAFLSLIQSGTPKLYQAFAPMHPQGAPGADTMKALYKDLATADLSKHVLSTAPERLRVHCLGNVGWSDLGHPDRLMEVLSRTGEKTEWSTLWSRDALRPAPNVEHVSPCCKTNSAS